MRLPVRHYHIAVTTGLILGLFLIAPGLAGAEQGLVRLYPAQSGPLDEGDVPQSPAENGGGDSLEAPDDIPDDMPDDGGEDALADDALSEPAAPDDATTASRLREREDLDLLFAELAQPDGETWARAETDILRIWSRSGSAAMDLLYKKGEAALDGGDATAAIGHLTALTDHAPDFAGGWYLRGVAFYLNGDFGPAISDMAEALGREPHHFGALTQLGSMLEELGDTRGALNAYRASLKIHPHQQDAADAVTRLEQEQQGTDA